MNADAHKSYKPIIFGLLIILGSCLVHILLLFFVQVILAGEGIIGLEKLQGYQATIKLGFEHRVTLPHMILSVGVLIFGLIFGLRMIIRQSRILFSKVDLSSFEV